ncbi:MAG TPA: M43 family zinc metalloprotease [Chitinophagaceae bacterium]|jgi:hypothetical protein
MLMAIPVCKRLTGLLLTFAFIHSYAQEIPADHCGTEKLLQKRFQQHPALKTRFETREKQFKQIVSERLQKVSTGTEKAAIFLTVPVVFHIVLSNPSLVTDAQIKAQLDTLNKDYAGTNGDTLNIPAWFKPLFGKANIQFALALQTPDGEPTTGIERNTTSHGPFDVFTTDVKHAATGGVDAWNTDNYLNVWICELSSGYLGLATFPDDNDSANQGAMIEYRSIPGGSFTNYNGGKTLSHEIGHYFNLYHVWGDDNGACTGTDYVDDTPNQANYTSGCPGTDTVVIDACSLVAPGILYQDYMDYSYDNCLVMFTQDQVARMQAAALTYRSALFTSPGLTAPVLKNYDARLKAIVQPTGRICTNNFAPVVTLHNSGSVTLASVTISTAIDGVVAGTYNWTGTLGSLSDASVTLNSVTVTPGAHTLLLYTSNPDGQADQKTSNDTLSSTILYYTPSTTPLTEGFEGTVFPPAGWDIINSDASYTWMQTNSAAKTGSNSAVIQNYYYSTYGAKDYLRLPLLNLVNADSAFLGFQVAASTYTALGTLNNTWDTLEVVVSTDCGNSYSSLYKKWGDTLVTAPSTTSYFTPTASQWRKDSVNITPYIGMGNILLAFVNTTENENNIYLDDINVYTKTVNPNLKTKGFMVTPNPASQTVAVQFYPQPSNLRGIEIYSMTGQKLAEMVVGSGPANSYYTFDVSSYAAGIYIVRAVFTDKVLTQKLMKK